VKKVNIAWAILLVTEVVLIGGYLLDYYRAWHP
jgi:hypothetical protein